MQHIKQSEHVFIAGRNGSGKTELAYAYLSGFEYVRVLDIKGQFNPKYVDKENIGIVSELSKLSQEANKKKYIVYRPKFEELDNDYYNEFFKWCYFQQNCTVCVDEVMGIYEQGSRVLPYHKAILTRGRELNVNIFNLTQRPSGIPQLIISESIHFFIYNLNLEADRDKIARITGNDTFYELPGKYNFWYFNYDLDEPEKGRLNIKGKRG